MAQYHMIVNLSSYRYLRQDLLASLRLQEKVQYGRHVSIVLTYIY